MKLNKIEQLKVALSPYSYFSNIEKIDLDNLTESDRFYLKSFGIYNFKVRPENFTIRVRVTAGTISVAELKLLSSFIKKYGVKLILTARSQIEIHEISSKDILDIYRDISESSLSSFQTLGDNIRNIVSDPLDGKSLTNKIEVLPTIKEIESLFLEKEEFMGQLPRKFNIAISGNESNINSFFSNDLYFALAKKEGIYGFNIYLGGKNSDIAKNADIFIKKEDVPGFAKAVVKAYNRYAPRQSRGKSRLFHLIEHIGIEKFKDHIKEFYAKEFDTAGETVTNKENHSSFIPIKNGKFAFRYNTDFGQIDLSELENIISFAKKENLNIKLGTDQNIYLIGLKEKSIPFENSGGSPNIIACAGTKYCFFSIFDVKEKAHELDIKKIDEHNIKIGYSGCLKGCGRHQFCDIGLISIRTNAYGEKEHAVRFFLGGEYSTGKAVAKMIYWAVPLRELNNLIDTVIDEFTNSGYDDFEEFSQNILNSFEREFLSIWFLAKLKTGKKVYLDIDKKNEPEYLKETFGLMPNNGTEETIRELIHDVWDQS